MEIASVIEIGSKFLSYVLGFSSIESNEMVLYRILAVFILGWLCLFGFLIIRKSKSLKHWRIPHLVSISAIILVSSVGFFISYILILNFNMLIIITENINEPINFLTVLFFMIFYISFGLDSINKKLGNGENSEELIPKEVGIFVWRSIMLGFGLLVVVLSQLFLLKYLGRLPFDLNVSPSPPWFYLAAFLFFFLAGILLCYFSLARKKSTEFFNKMDKFMENNLRVPFIFMFVIFIIILIDKIIRKDSDNLIRSAFISAVFLVISIFIKKINKWVVDFLKNLGTLEKKK